MRASVRALIGAVLWLVCATGASAQATETCALPFPVPAEVADARVVMVSEIHGTHESYRLAAELACTFSRNGTPVTVAIEMPRDEQAALGVYLESDGGEAARSELISRPYWQTAGLNTVATLAMIERIRGLRRSGARLSLLAIDASVSDRTPPPTLTAEQEEGVRAMIRQMGPAGERWLPSYLGMVATTVVRDRVMAQLLGDAIRSDPAGRFVVVLGGAHLSKLKGVPFAGVDSMASVLVSQGFSLTSLSALPLAGSFWGCLIDGGGNCGAHEFPKAMLDAQAAGRSPGIHLSDDLPGYDGVIVFERVTAAEPANPAAAAQAQAN